jgi:serine/threonine protein phosphatase PrpC
LYASSCHHNDFLLPEAHLSVINCPNPSCRTANPEGNETCQACQSALPHRYLWAVGALVATLKPGSLINQRYLLKREAIFLDTQPGVVPESLPELPGFLLPYLHLSAYPLHVPRPYALMRTADDDYVLMLESSALSAFSLASSTAAKQGGNGHKVPTQLPRLVDSWSEAPPLRQLNWLWQISQLWDACYEEQVAGTLLNDDFLRVDGSVLRLLALDSEPRATAEADPAGRAMAKPAPGIAQPSLMDLGRSWQPLVASAHQAVRTFLDRVCDRLERQQLNAEQLSEQLTQAMSVCAQGQLVSYDLAVYTDQGPTRKRNEDACYPASGTLNMLTSQQTKSTPQLLIVCDGIGGHQGGDVASKLALTTIESRLGPLLSSDRHELNATELCLAIEAAICAANDEISAQNDQAQRQARDRMGTTLVLALIKGADVYIAHLGDSRAYRISTRNCQQVTLDDDVASRQVRLGGSLYREVLLQPGSGSLIQALGMSSSQTLRPTVQRFVIDESCVFLLCSDGLSDSDRVEQFWPSLLRPLLTEEKSTAKVGKQLVDVANKYNGHDNVTVGLLNAHVVRDSDRMVPRDLAIPSSSQQANDQRQATDQSTTGSMPRTRRGITQITQQMSSPAAGGLANVAGEGVSSAHFEEIEQAPTAIAQTQKIPSAPAHAAPKIAAVLALLAALGGALYFLNSALGSRLTAASDGTLSSSPSELAAPNPQKPSSPPLGSLTPADLKVGTYVRIRQSDFPGIVSSAPDGTTPNRTTAPDTETAQLKLYPKPTTAQRAIPGTLSAGSIVQVMEQQISTAEKTTWVRLKLCSIPSGASIYDAPAETDSPKASKSTPGQNDQGNSSANGSGTDQSNTIILSPGKEGWAIALNVAAVADNVKDLQPTQLGNCER